MALEVAPCCGTSPGVKCPANGWVPLCLCLWLWVPKQHLGLGSGRGSGRGCDCKFALDLVLLSSSPHLHGCVASAGQSSGRCCSP